MDLQPSAIESSQQLAYRDTKKSGDQDQIQWNKSSHQRDMAQLTRGDASEAFSAGSSNLLLHLLPDLHRRIICFFCVTATCTENLRSFNKRGNRRKVVIRRKVIKEGARNADEWSIWIRCLAPFNRLRGPLCLSRQLYHENGRTNLDGRTVHDNFMKASLDEATCDMLNLLACLYKQILARWRENHGDAFSRIPSPDMKARVP